MSLDRNERTLNAAARASADDRAFSDPRPVPIWRPPASHLLADIRGPRRFGLMLVR